MLCEQAAWAEQLWEGSWLGLGAGGWASQGRRWSVARISGQADSASVGQFQPLGRGKSSYLAFFLMMVKMPPWRSLWRGPGGVGAPPWGDALGSLEVMGSL